MPAANVRAVPARDLRPDDADQLRQLIDACRAYAAPDAFPAVEDVASLLADPHLARKGALWPNGHEATAWCLAQPEFGNLLFDVHPARRTVDQEDDVLTTGLERLATADTDTADTPVESDDRWRGQLLHRWGFEDTNQDVIHFALQQSQPAAVRLPEGWRVRPLGGELDRYVALHRAAFGTDYLTVERRATWAQEPGYDPELDLIVEDADGQPVAFCVCWAPTGQPAELGTIGVRPDQQGRGLGRQVARAALARLAERQTTQVKLSTSSTNAAMLAVAGKEGFVEVRRTRWLRRKVVRS